MLDFPICQRLKKKISKNSKFFSNLKLQNFFVILGKHFQSLGLGNILLRFYIITTQNIGLFMVRFYLNVNQIL